MHSGLTLNTHRTDSPGSPPYAHYHRPGIGETNECCSKSVHEERMVHGLEATSYEGQYRLDNR